MRRRLRPTLFPYTTLFRSIPRPFRGEPAPVKYDHAHVGLSGLSGWVRCRAVGHLADPDPRLDHSEHNRSERRSEEHTSELQSQFHLVYRLPLEKKNANDSE